MYFEGSEKKAEIMIHSHDFSLIDDVPDELWHTLVSRCHAKIISTINNNVCKAFLLSESSLFVWHDRLLILTCGVTQLVKSVEYFIQHIDNSKIKQITYQRKNEYFSHEQPSCFADDVHLLNRYFIGKAFRFGELDSHHTYVFQYINDAFKPTVNKSYEFRAYQIGEKASKLLTTPNLTVETIRNFLGVDEWLPGFMFDDFVFDPYGYSLNAINNQQFLTIHVTPQEGSSYVSVESNINLITLAPKMIDVLAPASFDLFTVNEGEFLSLTQQFVPKGFISQSLVQQEVSHGPVISFANFIKPKQSFSSAKAIDIQGVSKTL